MAVSLSPALFERGETYLPANNPGALYTRVDAAAAKRLVNRTVVIPDTGGDALVTIEVQGNTFLHLYDLTSHLTILTRSSTCSTAW